MAAERGGHDQASWHKVDPDNAVDRLPQPFRRIAKILEEIVLGVEEHIEKIVRKRSQEEYEHSLSQVVPSSVISVPGRITCIHSEPRGTTRIAIGTGAGEAWLVDTQTQAVVAQRHAFGDGEAVSCVALCSDGAYGPRPRPSDQEDQPMQVPRERPHTKLFVAGKVTPRILVFDVRKHAYGVLLEPACAIVLPARESSEAESPEQPRALVEQLQTRGAEDGVWLLALMWDRTIRAYFVPLGPPEDQAQASMASEGMLGQPILEDEEEEDGEAGATEGGDEFKVQVKTAMYVIELANLTAMPGLPEPGLDCIRFTATSARADPRRIAMGTSARQLPLSLMVSSTESNVVLGYSLRAPGPRVAPSGMEVDALLKQTLPVLGESLPEPEESSSAQPRRRWALPAQTTSTAASPDGVLFAAGGARGSLALIDLGRGMSLRAMLSGHYAAVTALAFHRSDILVSAGEDSWIHHYDVVSGTVLARYLCAPPVPLSSGETRQRAEGVATAQMLPLAITVDDAAGMRLHDLRRGRKIARAVHSEAADEQADFGGATAKTFGDDLGDAETGGIPEAALPRTVLASGTAFCVVCSPAQVVVDKVNLADGEVAAEDAKEDGEEEDEQEGVAATEVDRSWLALFDYRAALKALYPGLGSKADRGLAALAGAFNSLPMVDTSSGLQGSNLEMAPPPLAPSETQAPLGGATMPPSALTSHPGGTRRPSMATQRQEATAPVLPKLTEENLRRMGGRQSQAIATGGAHESMVVSSGPQGDDADAGRRSGEKSAGVAQENWQVSVRRSLRKGLSEKELRARRMRQRFDQLRKDLEGPAPGDA